MRCDHGAQFFTARDLRFARAVATWCERGVVAEWEGRIVRLGADGHAVPAHSGTYYVGTPTMQAFPSHLARGLNLRMSTPVGAMVRFNGEWHLSDRAGTVLDAFDSVVVAVPAPRAAPFLAASPSMQQVAAAVPVAPCWAVMLTLTRDMHLGFDAAFVCDSALAWIARDSSKPNRAQTASWVLHASTEWSAAHLDSKGEAVAAALEGEFARLVGRWPLPVIGRAAHRWRHARVLSWATERSLFDPAIQLGACGDWCGGPRVEGAYLSGIALAARLLATEPAELAPS